MRNVGVIIDDIKGDMMGSKYFGALDDPYHFFVC